MSAPASAPVRRVLRSARGALELVADDESLAEALAAHVLGRPAPGRDGGERVALAGTDAWLKLGPLRGRARWRHAARERLLRAPLPRMRERANLLWLRAHGFDAPRPLAAGALRRRGLPVLQALATEWVADVAPLDALWPRIDGARRAELAAALGALVGRLHAAGFAHRDLFPRNLLAGASGPARVLVLDCWRGGPGRAPPGRGRAHDLACLMLGGATLFDEGEQRALLGGWLAALDVPADASRRVLVAVERERARLRRRLAARGRADALAASATWTAPRAPRDTKVQRSLPAPPADAKDRHRRDAGP